MKEGEEVRRKRERLCFFSPLLSEEMRGGLALCFLGLVWRWSWVCLFLGEEGTHSGAGGGAKRTRAVIRGQNRGGGGRSNRNGKDRELLFLSH